MFNFFFYCLFTYRSLKKQQQFSKKRDDEEEQQKRECGFYLQLAKKKLQSTFKLFSCAHFFLIYIKCNNNIKIALSYLLFF